MNRVKSASSSIARSIILSCIVSLGFLTFATEWTAAQTTINTSTGNGLTSNEGTAISGSGAVPFTETFFADSTYYRWRAVINHDTTTAHIVSVWPCNSTGCMVFADTNTFNANVYPEKALPLGTSGTFLQAGSSAPAWSSYTLPTSGTSGGLLYFSSGTSMAATTALTNDTFLQGVTGSAPTASAAVPDCHLANAGIVYTQGSTHAFSCNSNFAQTNQINTFGAFLNTFQAGTNFDLVDPTDTTKIGQFNLSGLSTGVTKILKWPTTAGTIAASATTPIAVGPATGAISLQNSAAANITAALGTDTKYFTASGSPAVANNVITGDAQGGIQDSGVTLCIATNGVLWLPAGPNWPQFTGTSGQAVSGTANNLRIQMVSIPCQYTLSHFNAEVISVSDTGTFNFGLYTVSGTTATKVLDSGSVSCNVATNTAVTHAITSGPVTINPGPYLLVWAASNTTCQIQGQSSPTNLQNMANQNSILVFSSDSNASDLLSGGSLPATFSTTHQTASAFPVPVVVMTP